MRGPGYAGCERRVFYRWGIIDSMNYVWAGFFQSLFYIHDLGVSVLKAYKGNYSVTMKYFWVIIIFGKKLFMFIVNW